MLRFASKLSWTPRKLTRRSLCKIVLYDNALRSGCGGKSKNLLGSFWNMCRVLIKLAARVEEARF